MRLATGASGLALLLLAACGGRTQRAAVSPAPPASAAARAPIENAREFVVDTARSRFEVWGEDIMSGDHRITFARWKAHVRNATEPEIHAEIDMCSAEIDLAHALRILRYELLECDRYPRSTLDATMKATGAKPNEQLVEGISDLHGVRKKLRFTGLLSEEGAGADRHYRFTAAFVISRKTFNIRYGPAEPFLKDDVRVIIDVVAVPAAQAPAQPPPAAPEPVEPGSGAAEQGSGESVPITWGVGAPEK